MYDCDACMIVMHFMLRLGFNAYAKNDFHEHPSQVSIVSVLQARATNWKINIHRNTKHKTSLHLLQQALRLTISPILSLLFQNFQIACSSLHDRFVEQLACA